MLSSGFELVGVQLQRGEMGDLSKFQLHMRVVLVRVDSRGWETSLCVKSCVVSPICALFRVLGGRGGATEEE